MALVTLDPARRAVRDSAGPRGRGMGRREREPHVAESACRVVRFTLGDEGPRGGGARGREGRGRGREGPRGGREGRWGPGRWP